MLSVCVHAHMHGYVCVCYCMSGLFVLRTDNTPEPQQNAEK